MANLQIFCKSEPWSVYLGLACLLRPWEVCKVLYRKKSFLCHSTISASARNSKTTGQHLLCTLLQLACGRGSILSVELAIRYVLPVWGRRHVFTQLLYS